MRYSELKALLKQIGKPSRSLKYEQIKGTTDYRISGLDHFRDLVQKFVGAPLFEQHAMKLRNLVLMNKIQDEVIASAQNNAEFQFSVHQLDRTAEDVLQLLEEMDDKTDKNCIRIRLPEPADFRTAVKDQETILKALEQVFLAEPFNSNIRIVSWETGSLWFVLSLGAVIAVECLGRIIWAAAVVRKKKFEGDLLRESAKKVGVEADFLEHLQEKTTAAINDLLKMETKAVKSHFSGDRDDPEAEERLKETIRTFAELIGRGAEVVPALMQPERAKEVFPDFKTLDTIISKVPQLNEQSASGDSAKPI